MVLSVRVSQAALLKHGETKVFLLPTEHGDAQGFVIRHGGSLHAYENRCRHWPIPLDLGNADFYHASLDRIRCKYHGAEFHPVTGECVAGPCKGDRLRRFDLEVHGADALVLVP